MEIARSPLRIGRRQPANIEWPSCFTKRRSMALRSRGNPLQARHDLRRQAKQSARRAAPFFPLPRTCAGRSARENSTRVSETRRLARGRIAQSRRTDHSGGSGALEERESGFAHASCDAACAQKNAPAAAATSSWEKRAGAEGHCAWCENLRGAAGRYFSSIAAKFYKNRARWKEIRDANFQGATGTPKITSGQKLAIP